MVVCDSATKCPELCVLGTFRFQARERALPAVLGGSQRLLALLALRDRALMRVSVAGTLWPGSSQEQAAASLRSALGRLSPVARDAVVVTPIDLRLADDVVVDIRDSRALARRLLDPDSVLSATDLSAGAVDTLSVDLLPDWYDDWVVIEAEEWRQLRLHALEVLSERLLAKGRFGDATIASLAVVRAEPLRESARASVIRVHLAEGNQAEALAEYERYRAILLTELGLEPTTHLRELITEPEATCNRTARVNGRAFRAFDATPDAATEARRFVRETIDSHAERFPEFGSVAAPAALLATAFVSEAIGHRADAVHVLALCRDDRVRVEVYDTRRASNVSEGEAPEASEIRLRLLSELADRWSMEYVGSGQLNWFELRVDSAPPSRVDSWQVRGAHSKPRSANRKASKPGRALEWLGRGSNLIGPMTTKPPTMESRQSARTSGSTGPANPGSGFRARKPDTEKANRRRSPG